MATQQKPTSKVRWADLLDEENDDFDFSYVLPPRQVIGPDENGIKKIIEYKLNEDMNMVKVTTTVKVRKVIKRAFERRSWAKFGGAADGHLTVVSPEQIFLERPGSSEATTRDPLATSDAIMLCRYCGKKAEHWSARCPQKDLLAPPPPPPDPSGKGKYVPPIRRPGAKVDTNCDEISVRVSNLSPEVREADLVELFGTFGAVSRAHVIVDQATGVSREFGFVHFYKREDAQRAIDKLDGYGYDNLILHVDWAKPRTG